MIQSQCRTADTIKATELGTEISEGSSLLRQVKGVSPLLFCLHIDVLLLISHPPPLPPKKQEMHGTTTLVNDSATALENVRKTIDCDIEDLLKMGSIIDSFVQPPRPNTTSNAPNHAKFQLEFFIKKTLSLEDRMKAYEETLEFVEIQLKGLADRPNPGGKPVSLRVNACCSSLKARC